MKGPWLSINIYPVIAKKSCYITENSFSLCTIFYKQCLNHLICILGAIRKALSEYLKGKESLLDSEVRNREHTIFYRWNFLPSYMLFCKVFALWVGNSLALATNLAIDPSGFKIKHVKITKALIFVLHKSHFLFLDPFFIPLF